ncbi:hypothetical protein [Curtobacterium oceanosedimentum]|uniref:hypothetical protein n=1 Tax=Curtobacterium oceanosedimentum TaxID=465820 RepID=UPI00128ECA9C|nr:hypothetical protein [Curtobacterium oceanosedimentum]
MPGFRPSDPSKPSVTGSVFDTTFSRSWIARSSGCETNEFVAWVIWLRKSARSTWQIYAQEIDVMRARYIQPLLETAATREAQLLAELTTKKGGK